MKAREPVRSGSKRGRHASTAKPESHAAAAAEQPAEPSAAPAGGNDQGGPPESHDPLSGCLLRLFWLMIGNVALAASAIGITDDPALAIGSADAIYWAVVGSLLAARYGDIRYFHGRTTDGRTATMAHWRRYAAVLVAASAAIWLLAHAAAYVTAQVPTGEGP